MSYIAGLDGVTSANEDRQAFDQQKQGSPGRTGADDGRGRVVPDLYPRRSLGQRLTDTALVAGIFPFALIAVLAVSWQDRKAGTR